MKSTGIVRRIDDLGRVVIPKEIRKNLKIKENESLEIFIDGDNIILKKYSNLTDKEKVFNDYISVLNDITGNEIIITDRDKVLVSSKKNEKYIGREISDYLNDVLNSRNRVLSNDNWGLEIVDNEKIDCNYYIIPMIINSDIIGLMAMLSKNEIDDLSKLSMEIISKIIVNTLE